MFRSLTKYESDAIKSIVSWIQKSNDVDIIETYNKLIHLLSQEITPDIIYEIGDLMTEKCSGESISLWAFHIRSIYNSLVAWPIVNRSLIDTLVNEFGTSRVIDFGAGRGVISYLLKDRGVNIIPIDSDIPKFTFTKVFSNSYLKSHGGFKRGDILFISWGRENMESVVEKYVRKCNSSGMGKVVMIEEESTLTSEYLEQSGWNPKLFDDLDFKYIDSFYGTRDVITVYTPN